MYALWVKEDPNHITMEQTLMSYGQQGTYYTHPEIKDGISYGYIKCISYSHGVFTFKLESNSSWPGEYTINWEAWD